MAHDPKIQIVDLHSKEGLEILASKEFLQMAKEVVKAKKKTKKSKPHPPTDAR